MRPLTAPGAAPGSSTAPAPPSGPPTPASPAGRSSTGSTTGSSTSWSSTSTGRARGAGRARVLLSALVAGIVAPVLAVTAATPAAAFAPAPLLPVSMAIASGIPAASAGTASTVGLIGAGTVAAPAVLVGGAGLAVGAGIGWAGMQAWDFASDRWFSDHPTPQNVPEGAGELTAGGYAVVYGSATNVEAAPVAEYAWPFSFVYSAPVKQRTSSWYCGSRPATPGPTGNYRYDFAAGDVFDGITRTPDCSVEYPGELPELRIGQYSGADTFGRWMIDSPDVVIYPRRQFPPSSSWTVNNTGQCQFADGTFIAVSSASEVFTPDAPLQRTPALNCPAGSHPTTVTQTLTGDSGEVVPSISWALPPEATDVRAPGVAGEVARSGSTAPQLYWVPEGEPGADGLPSGEPLCRYGTTVLPASECEPYEPQPEPEAPPSTGTEPLPPPRPPGDAECRSTLIIFGGVVCALQEAFLPSVSPSQAVAPLVQAVSVRPPASWYLDLTATAKAPLGMAGGGSCPQWSVKIGDHRTEDLTCDSSFNLLLHYSRPVMLGMMVLTAFAPLLRSLFYAAIPFVRVTPTP